MVASFLTLIPLFASAFAAPIVNPRIVCDATPDHRHHGMIPCSTNTAGFGHFHGLAKPTATPTAPERRFVCDPDGTHPGMLPCPSNPDAFGKFHGFKATEAPERRFVCDIDGSHPGMIPCPTETPKFGGKFHILDKTVEVMPTATLAARFVCDPTGTRSDMVPCPKDVPTLGGKIHILEKPTKSESPARRFVCDASPDHANKDLIHCPDVDEHVGFLPGVLEEKVVAPTLESA